MSLDGTENQDGPQIIVRNNVQASRNRVFDLHSWLLAWSLFLQATIIFRGHLVSQMLKYQSFIAQLASNYNFQAWFSYDQSCRLAIANNPHLRWDTVNEDIYNLHIRGAQGRSRCFSCGGRDHYASSCTSKCQRGPTNAFPSGATGLGSVPRERAASYLRPPQASFANSNHSPFLDPQLAQLSAQSSEFCRMYNF